MQAGPCGDDADAGGMANAYGGIFHAVFDNDVSLANEFPGGAWGLVALTESPCEAGYSRPCRKENNSQEGSACSNCPNGILILG